MRVPWCSCLLRCREGWSRGWEQARGRAVWGNELPSLWLGPATGWDFPPEAAVRAGWCWVLGTAPGFCALEMMLEMGRWCIVSIREARACLQEASSQLLWVSTAITKSTGPLGPGMLHEDLCHALPLWGCFHRASGRASPSLPVGLPQQRQKMRATNKPGWTNLHFRQ